MALSTSQRALAHSASGADGFHHTRPPIKYASRSRGLTQVYVRTQLGGQSLQNGDIAGSSAATRKPGAKVLAKSSSGGFRPRTVPTDPLDGYAIADLPPDAMLAEAAAFARKAAAGRRGDAERAEARRVALRRRAGRQRPAASGARRRDDATAPRRDGVQGDGGVGGRERGAAILPLS